MNSEGALLVIFATRLRPKPVLRLISRSVFPTSQSLRTSTTSATSNLRPATPLLLVSFFGRHGQRCGAGTTATLRVAPFGGRKVASLGGHKVAPLPGRRHAGSSRAPGCWSVAVEHRCQTQPEPMREEEDNRAEKQRDHHGRFLAVQSAPKTEYGDDDTSRQTEAARGGILLHRPSEGVSPAKSARLVKVTMGKKRAGSNLAPPVATAEPRTRVVVVRALC